MQLVMDIGHIPRAPEATVEKSCAAASFLLVK